ncbi:phosphoesterase family-domain-containing protein [Talaromyces proteolyticus]|uniref:Phosphoesterase family-domain-containing protein n=1 Tax=Talaromyces proteolyticus TaxID=1131652 RepID=A0AAD4PXB8_9EURO|nr:phosphoesterase family-domain-containing protein [Talaromyces proteolyticus]KAH8696229.1 phosphoesterase family-domain-containing protein [Talaromyces proteolyticus]
MRAAGLVAASAVATAVQAGSLQDIKHIVLFMQENRAFDHYFGTMAGVRGFGDPNAQVNPDGRSVLEHSTQNGADILKPWHLNYLGHDEWYNATQCMGAGDNGWQTMHTAYSGGLGNQWTGADGGYSLGYFTRQDIPTHFDIAEGWTILDMNMQSLLMSTDPNRIMWMSGSVNIPGSPTNLDGTGGMIIDNSNTPGCESTGVNCFPFVWKTFPEYLEEAGISWQVWQDLDNFEDNMLAYFQQYQQAPNGSALNIKGNSYPGLDAFYGNASAGTLPQVSWIIGPQEQAEHPPNMPKDGAWLQQKVVEAITSSPAYNETVLIISYDEQGGWADHVVPVVPEKDTPGEWMTDPYNGALGDVPVGPGWRVPRFIISPWTRGGNVFTEPSDHNSDVMFVEKWAAANGYNSVHTEAITQWRRTHMSNLVNAFDFDNPDYSIPTITTAAEPPSKPEDPGDYSGNLDLGSLTGPWVGPASCLAEKKAQVPIPYGVNNANQDLSLVVEDGFKRVRGSITEGRYLTIETEGQALTNLGNASVGLSPGTKDHGDINQRWIVHPVGGPGYGNIYYVQSASDLTYITGFPAATTLTADVKNAQAITITYTPNGATYNLISNATTSSGAVNRGKSRRSAPRNIAGSSLSLEDLGEKPFEIFSVSYKNSSMGSVVVPDPGLVPGSYKAYFCANNGYTPLTDPVTFTVKDYGGSISFQQGSRFTFTYSTGSANSKNWIAIYYASGGGPDDQQKGANSLAWSYATDGSGSVTVSDPGLASGSYRAYFLANDGYSWLANPIVFNI